MKKRTVIVILSAVAGVAALLALLWTESGAGDSRRSGLVRNRRGLSGPWETLSKQSGGSHFEAAPVRIEFDHVPLPEVLDKLVKLTGLSVTADLDETQDQTAVTIQAFIPPLEALMSVAEDYGLELVETGGGWWLRPQSPAIRMIYQPSILSMDEERNKRLIQTLQEILDSGSPGKAAGTVTLDGGGIHVTASKAKQNFVSSYLNVLFDETVPSKNADPPVAGIPPLSK